MCLAAFFFSVMSVRSIQAVACKRSFLSCFQGSPLCACHNVAAPRCVRVQPPPEGGCPQALCSADSGASSLAHVCRWAAMLSALSLRPAVRVLGYAFICSLTGCQDTVSKVAEPVYTPTNHFWEPESLHTLRTQHPVILFFFFSPCDSLALVFLVLWGHLSSFNLHFLSRAMAFIAFSCVYWLIE